MEIRLSDTVEKIVERLVASGKFSTAEDAVNAMFLSAVNSAELQHVAEVSSAANGNATESPFEKAKRLGLIGAARGLPADLSSNKQHMEGFGRA